MAWVPIPQRLRDGAEMMRLRRATGQPVAVLLGHITLLWLWALDNAPDGRLPQEPFILAEAMHWEGDPGEWLRNLEAAGFIFPADAATGEYEIAYFIELMAAYAEKAAQRRSSSRDRVRAFRERTRLAQAELGGPEQYRTAVFARDGHACAYCGATAALCLDHIIPVARGGGHGPDNLTVACRACVGRKAGRTPEEAGLTLSNAVTLNVTEGLQRGYSVTPSNALNTIQNTTQQTHPTVTRARNPSVTGVTVTEGGEESPWTSTAEKFGAFRDYTPSQEDREWAAREVPEIDIDAETRGNYAEWCDTNRRKLVTDYDNPTGFWRRWMRGAAERQARSGSRGNSNGRRSYADDRLAVGEVAEAGDSRERARQRRARALPVQ